MQEPIDKNTSETMIKVDTKLILYDSIVLFFKFRSSLYVSGSYIYTQPLI